LDSISQTELWYLHKHPIKEVLNRRFYENKSTVCNAVHPKICSENARNVVLGVKNIKPQMPLLLHTIVWSLFVDCYLPVARPDSDGNLGKVQQSSSQPPWNVRTYAPINVNPQRGGGRAICGVFDHQLHPHPGDFD
jgi:hypothetical protein